MGTRNACRAVGRSRATHYRQHPRSPRPPSSPRPRPQPAKQSRALTEPERTADLEALRSKRFVDKAPTEIQAILLDEGTYLCSVATMYRLLRAHGETGERRAQATHPEQNPRSEGRIGLNLKITIESLNARYRRAVRARGHFPTEQAALKCLYLVTRSLDPTGAGRARWTMRWKLALNAFAITFADRWPAAENY